MSETHTADAISEREYITFRASDQEFCTEVTCVREIRGWTPVTALPHAPSYVRGVINLRGAVLPVIDLAERLGFPPTEPTARHVIMVLQIERQIVGLLVEAVSDIIMQNPNTIQPIPEVASDVTKAFVRGVMAIEGRMVSLLALTTMMPTAAREAA